MKGLVLLAFLVVGVVVASDDPKDSAEWKHAVEEVMASVVLGPLRPDFGPEALRRRTREGAVRAQTNRLRARVAVAMIESTGELVEACLLEHTSPEAARALVDELRAHNFTSASWIRDERRCHGGYIRVEVPPPAEK
jgi:hypothetical protein